mmetsp:Transcript_3501/g.10831  ORF Transcript_3501/g.10831 Transcript_3501/m.10831 type:complete len:1220 (+) Transcript_3501:38-3697(+)
MHAFDHRGGWDRAIESSLWESMMDQKIEVYLKLFVTIACPGMSHTYAGAGGLPPIMDGHHGSLSPPEHLQLCPQCGGRTFLESVKDWVCTVTCDSATHVCECADACACRRFYGCMHHAVGPWASRNGRSRHGLMFHSAAAPDRRLPWTEIDCEEETSDGSVSGEPAAAAQIVAAPPISPWRCWGHAAPDVTAALMTKRHAVFCRDLAAAGGGTYRYFGRGDAPPGVDVPVDVRVLEKEMAALTAEMNDVEDLRRQCRNFESEAAEDAITFQPDGANTTSRASSAVTTGTAPLKETPAMLRGARAVRNGDARPPWEGYAQPSRHDPSPPTLVAASTPRPPLSTSAIVSMSGRRPEARSAVASPGGLEFSGPPTPSRAGPAAIPRRSRPEMPSKSRPSKDKVLEGLPIDVASRLRRVTRPNPDGVADWLIQYSHTALKLTVADALDVTAIRRKGTYVPSLGKYVYPRVFDEVFLHCRLLDTQPGEDGSLYRLKDVTSGASVSSSSQPELVYVFPEAANLDSYRTALRDVIEIYRGILADLARGSSGGDVAEADSIQVTSSNVDELVQGVAAVRDSSPGVEALGGEISAAEKTLVQFIELQTELDTRAFPAKPPPPPIEEESLLWTQARKARRARRRLGQKMLKGLPSVYEPAKGQPHKPVQKSRQRQSGKLPQTAATVVGTIVLGRVEGVPFFYRGKVTAEVKGAVTIQFDGGKSDNVWKRNLVALPDTVATYSRGDCVLVPALDVGNGAYLAGSVENVDGEGLVTVASVSGVVASFAPPKLLKVEHRHLGSVTNAWRRYAQAAMAAENEKMSTEAPKHEADAGPGAVSVNGDQSAGGDDGFGMAAVRMARATTTTGTTFANMSMEWDYDHDPLRLPSEQAPPTPMMSLVNTAHLQSTPRGATAGNVSLQWDGATLHDLRTAAAALEEASCEPPTDPKPESTPVVPSAQGQATEERQAVLVRWAADGWYYPAKARPSTLSPDLPTCVVEQDGGSETIQTTDVVVCSIATYAAGQKVLAEHPYQRESFAPAELMKVDRGGTALALRFFDGVEGTAFIHSTNDYNPQVVDESLHAATVDGIVALEEALVGEHVLCRSDADFLFHTGTVKARVHSGFFKVALGDAHGGVVDQLQNHIFRIPKDGSELRKLVRGEGVLVINLERDCCEPAKIAGEEDAATGTYLVRCWDSREARAAVVAVIGVEYFDFAVQLLEHHQMGTVGGVE